MKPRMKDIIEQLERTLRIEQEGIRERDQQIKVLQSQLRSADRLINWADRLLDGMCSAMKEGAMPRRTHL